MEQGTKYATDIAQLLKSQPSFSKIYQYNIDNYPKQYSYGQIFDALSNGTTVISGGDLLMCYMATYSGHHYHKLQTSFPPLLRNISNNANVEIIDYGCGQALATLVLLDYLLANNKSLMFKEVTLIEPSTSAIQRGELHLYHFFNAIKQNPNLKIFNKDIDSIVPNDLHTSQQNIKIHLFSNILDVNAFDLNNLYNKIKNSQKGVNYFVCVSPFNPTRQRLIDFADLFKNHNAQQIPALSQTITGKVFNIQSRQMQEGYKITMIQRIFSCIL